MSVMGDKASGTADPKGTFVTKLKPSKKLGKKKVTARGQFADIRSGSTTIRVVK